MNLLRLNLQILCTQFIILTLHTISLTNSTFSCLKIRENPSKRKLYTLHFSKSMGTFSSYYQFDKNVTQWNHFFLYGSVNLFFNGFRFNITYACQFSPTTNSPSRLDFSICSNPQHLPLLRLFVGHKWNVSPILQITCWRIGIFSFLWVTSRRLQFSRNLFNFNEIQSEYFAQKTRRDKLINS